MADSNILFFKGVVRNKYGDKGENDNWTKYAMCADYGEKTDSKDGSVF